MTGLKIFNRSAILLTASLLMACGQQQGGFRSYRHDLAKYRAIQAKLRAQLEQEQQQQGQQPPTSDQGVGSAGSDQGVGGDSGAAVNGGGAADGRSSGQDQADGSQRTGAASDSKADANPPAQDTVDPEVTGHLISEFVDEKLKGQLSIESLEKLFDSNTAQAAIQGLDAEVVTGADGKLEVRFKMVASPNGVAKVYVGSALPALNKKGITNKIALAVTADGQKADQAESAAGEVEGTLLCQDDGCSQMIGLITVASEGAKDAVIFKIVDGQALGPFKTFDEAKNEMGAKVVDDADKTDKQDAADQKETSDSAETNQTTEKSDTVSESGDQVDATAPAASAGQVTGEKSAATPAAAKTPTEPRDRLGNEDVRPTAKVKAKNPVMSQGALVHEGDVLSKPVETKKPAAAAKTPTEPRDRLGNEDVRPTAKDKSKNPVMSQGALVHEGDVLSKPVETKKPAAAAKTPTEPRDRLGNEDVRPPAKVKAKNPVMSQGALVHEGDVLSKPVEAKKPAVRDDRNGVR